MKQQDITSPMSSGERRATVSLAGIYALRMLGLFMILPVLSIYAEQLDGATPMLMGLAISIYGLTQALLQIPFGLMSDRFGRKRIIIIGLLLFSAGSIVAALASNIYWVLAGRALQGAGAIASAVMALLADLTDEVHRTKAMATVGLSIALSFGVAITLGPMLAGTIGVPGIFALTAVLALLAIVVLKWLVPNPSAIKVHRDAELIPEDVASVFKNAELLRLNYGIFTLHLILTASFVVLPLMLRDAGLAAQNHGFMYLPVFVLSLAGAVPMIIIAEKKRRMKPVFVAAIGLIVLAEAGLFWFGDSLPGLIAFIAVFFIGFNLLEATLPSLISKTAPADRKGTAMGFYSSAQFFGAFLGGVLAGGVIELWGGGWVFVCAGVLALSWLLLALTMKPPRYLANLLISVPTLSEPQETAFVRRLLAVTGVAEVKIYPEEQTAYLKVDNSQLDRDALSALLAEPLFQV